MDLRITTPLSNVFEIEGVVHVRAEDSSGAFGILPGHADFLTRLAVSVVSWRMEAGDEHHCAVRGGTLSVIGGEEIDIATREMVMSDTLEHLREVVVGELSAKAADEVSARSAESHLQAAAIDQIYRYLRPEEARGRVPQIQSAMQITSGIRIRMTISVLYIA